jgi:lipid-binding SYLF domain-containing protein
LTIAVYGAGIEGAVTTNAGADIVAFANSKSGLYAGFSLEGAVFIRRRDLNEAYYGAGATPESILAGTQSNPASQPLIQALGAPKR